MHTRAAIPSPLPLPDYRTRVRTSVATGVARWSRPISTDEHIAKAPFTVILAIGNVVEGCNKS